MGEGRRTSGRGRKGGRGRGTGSRQSKWASRSVRAYRDSLVLSDLTLNSAEMLMLCDHHSLMADQNGKSSAKACLKLAHVVTFTACSIE